MKKLEPQEEELIGEWITARPGGLARGSDACNRIEWLISGTLQLVGIDAESGGWDKLYRDPVDGRYWLLTYPHSEMHGGGPPQLKHLPLTEQEVKEKFVTPEAWDKHMEQFMRERNIRFVTRDEPSEK